MITSKTSLEAIVMHANEFNKAVAKLDIAIDELASAKAVQDSVGVDDDADAHIDKCINNYNSCRTALQAFMNTM